MVAFSTSPWVRGLALVVFDVDSGQRIARRAGDIGDEQAVVSRALPEGGGDGGGGVSSEAEQTAFRSTHFFGVGEGLAAVSNFRRVRSNVQKRGYVQEALVAITEVEPPHSPIIKAVCTRLSAVCFSRGWDACLELLSFGTPRNGGQGGAWMCEWPDPTDVTLPLAAGGGVGSIEKSGAAAETEIMCSVSVGVGEGGEGGGIEHHSLVQGPFMGSQGGGVKLWEMWEAIVCGTGLCFFGVDAGSVSEAVLSAKRVVPPDLITTWEPYMTVVDVDAAMSSADRWDAMNGGEGGPGRAVVLGCTNPLFADTCRSRGIRVVEAASVDNVDTGDCGSSRSSSSRSERGRRGDTADMRMSVGSGTRGRRTTGLLMSTAAARRAYREVAGTPGQFSGDVVSASLVGHFARLNDAFLAPVLWFRDHGESLTEAALFKRLPTISTLSSSQPLAPWGGTALQRLYHRFINSAAFLDWFQRNGGTVDGRVGDTEARFWWGVRTTDAPGSMPQGMLHGSRHLVQEVAHGVAGLVNHPIEGMRGKRGGDAAKGLVRGVGRGLVGLVTRPMAGVAGLTSDVVKGTLNGKSKASRIQEERGSSTAQKSDHRSS